MHDVLHEVFIEEYPMMDQEIREEINFLGRKVLHELIRGRKSLVRAGLVKRLIDIKNS